MTGDTVLYGRVREAVRGLRPDVALVHIGAVKFPISGPLAYTMNASDAIELIELVGELSTRSELFRQRWASRDVQYHRSGHKRLRHPVVGELDLDFEAMELPSEPGLWLNVYTAPEGSPTADALKLLASWAASQERLPTERSASVAG